MVLDILTENNHSTSDFSLQNILKYIQYLGELWKSTGHSHVLLSLLPFKMGSYSSYLINQSNEVFFFYQGLQCLDLFKCSLTVHCYFSLLKSKLARFLLPLFPFLFPMN